MFWVKEGYWGPGINPRSIRAMNGVEGRPKNTRAPAGVRLGSLGSLPVDGEGGPRQTREIPVPVTHSSGYTQTSRVEVDVVRVSRRVEETTTVSEGVRTVDHEETTTT